MTDKEAFDLIATHAIPCAQADGGPRQAPRVMNEAPKWTAIDEAMRWLNEVETVQGGANGPTIKLRAAILEMGEPVSATIDAVDEPGDWTPVAWITHAGRLCLQDGDGPVKAMPQMNEDCDFILPLYDRHTVADLGRTARALAVHVSEVRHAALRALVAWDGTVLPKAHDGLMQERMESLRTAIGA